MIIYNVTIKVNTTIQEAWVGWMKEVHIPEVMHTACFTKYTFVKLLEIDESEGPTYACQYFAEKKTDYDRYIELYSEKLRNDGFAKWGNQFIAFRTLMKVVN